MSIRYDLLKTWFGPLKPPADMTPAEWLARHCALSALQSSTPGPLVLHPWQAQILERSQDPNVRKVVCCLASQTGKSILVSGLLAFYLHHDGSDSPILLVRPDASDGANYVRTILVPLLESSGLKTSGGVYNGLRFLQTSTGYLRVASSYNAAELASAAIRILVCDEVDRFATSAGIGQGKHGGEGSPLALAEHRTKTFSDSKAFYTSTPVMEGGPIWQEYLKGGQAQFVCPCVECSEPFEMTPDLLVYDAKTLDGARLSCPHCGVLLDDRQRLQMLKVGFWRERNENPTKGIISFQGGELALSPLATLARIAQQKELARTSPEHSKVYTNLVCGLPHTFEQFAVDQNDLAQRVEPIEPPYSERILAITAAVDVQATRLELQFCGFGLRDEMWILDHIPSIPGDVGLDAPWLELIRILTAARFRTKDGRTLAPSITFIDSGFATNRVYAAVEKLNSMGVRCAPTFGKSGFDRPALDQTGVIGRGQRRGHQIRAWRVGVDGLKLTLTQRLAITDPNAQGYIHLPQHLTSHGQNSFLAGLTSEVLQTNSKGQKQWVRVRRNEVLDCAVLNLAASNLVTLAKPVDQSEISKLSAQVAQLNRTNSPAHSRLN